MIKDNDAHVRFTFLTGISKFSKVNLFSQLNNLTDITLDPAYSSICGYTEQDLDTVFAPEMAALDREQVRDWYNGYSWRGDEKRVQPVRRAAAVATAASSSRALVRDRHAGVSARHAVPNAGSRRCHWASMMSTEDLLSTFDVGVQSAADQIGTEAHCCSRPAT